MTLRLLISITFISALVGISSTATADFEHPGHGQHWSAPGLEKLKHIRDKVRRKLHQSRREPAQLGPRPLWLVETMADSPLKDKLQSCASDTMYASEFSIGHRGAPLQPALIHT